MKMDDMLHHRSNMPVYVIIQGSLLYIIFHVYIVDDWLAL
jgi:hypothetical protein